MIRAYTDADYDHLKQLYLHTEWYGGQFDEARDGRTRLAEKIMQDPEAIWLYEQDREVVGTVSLVDDGRVAMLFRLVVKNNDQAVTQELYKHAANLLRKRGHEQILVYTPTGDQALHQRYEQLGMTRGGEYTCYWAQLHSL